MSGRFAVADEGSYATTVQFEANPLKLHRFARAQSEHSAAHRKGHGSAIGGFDPQYQLLQAQAGVHVAHRKDGAVVVSPP